MQSALRHKGVRWIALGWAGFITENVVLSHNREWIITEFGKDTYMRAYAGLSSIANLSILYGYFRHGRRQGPTFPSVRRKVGLVTGGTTTLATALESAARKARASGPRLAAAVVLQAVGLGMMLQLAPKFQVPVEFRARAERLPILEAGASEEQSALVQGPQLPSSQQPSEGGITLRCPFDFSDRSQSQSGDGDEELYTGVHRISRHPGLWGLGLFGLGSAILTPFVAEALFFGMPCVFALIGGAHQDYRNRRNSGGYLSPEDDARTSNVPFIALIQGTQAWADVERELKWSNATMALTLVLGWRTAAWLRLRKVVIP